MEDKKLRIKATTNIEHDGKKFTPGQTVEVSEKMATQLCIDGSAKFESRRRQEEAEKEMDRIKKMHEVRIPLETHWDSSKAGVR